MNNLISMKYLHEEDVRLHLNSVTLQFLSLDILPAGAVGYMNKYLNWLIKILYTYDLSSALGKKQPLMLKL